MLVNQQGFGIKIVLLGSATVGKTSIVNAATKKDVLSDQLPTIGASLVKKEIKIKNLDVSLNIWDTAGQETYRSLAPLYFRQARVIILVYSVNSKDSFDCLNSWYDEVQEKIEQRPKYVVIGNKIDLERKVETKEGYDYAKSIDADFFEVSALSNPQQISDLFDMVAIDILNQDNALLQSLKNPGSRENGGGKCC